MKYEPLFRYLTPAQCNEFLLSLRLPDPLPIPRERQIACLYALSNHAERHYRPILLPKKDGTQRRILAPDPLLKTVQRNILRNVLGQMAPASEATAYRAGACVLRNAAPHVGKRRLLKLDIRDFFGSITYPMVLGRAFPATIFPISVRALLAHLCCHAGVLPQGAPTSPAISNLILRPFDRHMGLWCEKRGIAYTRYCDDMAFSGDFYAREVTAKVRGFLQEMDFSLNDRKIKLAGRNARQAVTGIVVNEKPNISREYRRKLRQEIHYCEKFGVEEHLAKTGTPYNDGAAYLRRLLGKVNHVLSVRPEDAYFREARERLRLIPIPV